MCDSHNEIDCPITISTIGNPDATFVAQKVGEDLQFRGVQVGGGVIGIITPTILRLDSISPIGPVPIDGVIGFFNDIVYSTLAPALQPTEIRYTLLTSTYNTGMFAIDTLSVPVTAYYKVCFNPGTSSLGLGASVTYRIRDSSSNIYAEFYSRSIGNDEYTSNFCHVMLLPAGDYFFSIQVLDLTVSEYNNFTALGGPFSVKRVG